jgi:hypothetical protein
MMAHIILGTKAHKIGLNNFKLDSKEFNNRLKDLVELTNLDEGKLDTRSQPNYPKQVKRILHQARLCSMECEKVVTDQHIELQLRTDMGCWLKHCRTCNRYQNPITKEFTSLHLVNHYYRLIQLCQDK